MTQVFVEDTTVVYKGSAVMARSGAPSRRGEGPAVAKALTAMGVSLSYMEAPATLDGGDVLICDNHIFVGNSARTNVDGFNSLRNAFTRAATAGAIPLFSFVPVSELLHLKSLATWAGDVLPMLVLIFSRHISIHI